MSGAQGDAPAGTPPFDPARFAALVRQRGLALGRDLHRHDQLVSTMDTALAAAQRGAPHGTVVVAEAQTGGRGRRGRPWYSAPGEALTFSVLLRPHLTLAAAPLLALATGLAVRDAVAARIRAPVLVKWPNDVLVEARKVAGVLVEGRLGGASATAIVGVGLNVETRSFPEELAGTATSLALAGAADRDRERWLADFLGGLASRLEALEQGGSTAITAELASVDALAGRAVVVGELRGFAAGIAPSGALLIRTERGDLAAVTTGTVELV